MRRTKLSPSPVWVGATTLLLLLLSACGTLVAPASEAADSDSRFDLVATVTIDETATRSELESASGGNVIVFRPEAGFAIVAFDKGQGDLALMSTADVNDNVITTPVANANGWTAWSGGWTAWSGGWTAWSGGWTAWSGGWTAWSGGWTAWSGGWTAWSGASTGSFGANLDAWNQIKLPQGQLLAPNLGSGVKVAVIDTGVSLNHPAFAGHLAPSGEWYDFVDNDTYPMDAPGGASTGHGTAVAGIILQVAPNATILPIRVLAADGSGDVDDVVQGIDHAISMGADVINLSLGTSVDLFSLKAMIDYATSQQIFVIASVGNEGSSDVLYPARYATSTGSTGQYLIGVGSIDEGNIKSSFSNYSVGAELFTPGEGIFTSTRNDTEEALVTNATGTSFSAPMVAGVVGLALGQSPSLAQQALLPSHLSVSATDLGPLNPPYVGQMGHGRLDIESFLTLMGNTAPNPVKSALLVVNTPPSSSDQFIADRLGLLGFSVSMIDDSAASSSTANGKDLVVISHTVSAGTIGSAYRNVTVPVITWEDGIFDDMKMSSSQGDMSGYDYLTVVSDHPLAVGFSGDTTVYQGSSRLAYGTPSASAIKVATVPGHADRAVVFAYEKGAEMVGMEAPAKRVGLFFQDYDAASFDYRGVALFDAAVMWSSYSGTVQPISSKTYLEAVNYSASEGAFFVGSGNDGAGSYMELPQSVGLNYEGLTTLGRLHYDAEVAVAGTYDVWFRVYGPDGSSDSFFVQLDGGSNYALHFGNQGSWRWVKVATVPLDGLHTLTVSHREGGARLDRILITSDTGFVPSGLGGY